MLKKVRGRDVAVGRSCVMFCVDSRATHESAERVVVAGLDDDTPFPKDPSWSRYDDCPAVVWEPESPTDLPPAGWRKGAPTYVAPVKLGEVWTNRPSLVESQRFTVAETDGKLVTFRLIREGVDSSRLPTLTVRVQDLSAPLWVREG